MLTRLLSGCEGWDRGKLGVAPSLRVEEAGKPLNYEKNNELGDFQFRDNDVCSVLRLDKRDGDSLTSYCVLRISYFGVEPSPPVLTLS